VEFEKIVLITKKTALEELIERFNTRDQARFYIEHMGGCFDEYEQAHRAYKSALDEVQASIPQGLRCHVIERGFLPTFTFERRDLVVTVGPDGLVVNAAKYLGSQPLVALNPDPARINGVLLPFRTRHCGPILSAAANGRLALTKVTMAKASLNDGQTLYAVNDLFIGQATHVSARYRLRFKQSSEDQSSSGVIVSTGAGSTGWLSSIITGAAAIVAALEPGHKTVKSSDLRFDWQAEQLTFSVREPFVSKTSDAKLVFGKLQGAESLLITSLMPQDGVIFSDGVENDYLQFNSGSIATIGVAERKLHLVTQIY
jgi:NAD kinase